MKSCLMVLMCTFGLFSFFCISANDVGGIIVKVTQRDFTVQYERIENSDEFRQVDVVGTKIIEFKGFGKLSGKASKDEFPYSKNDIHEDNFKIIKDNENYYMEKINSEKNSNNITFKKLLLVNDPVRLSRNENTTFVFGDLPKEEKRQELYSVLKDVSEKFKQIAEKTMPGYYAKVELLENETELNSPLFTFYDTNHISSYVKKSKITMKLSYSNFPFKEEDAISHKKKRGGVFSILRKTKNVILGIGKVTCEIIADMPLIIIL